MWEPLAPPPAAAPLHKIRALISLSLCPYMCICLYLYLIFYFFTHLTQTKSGRPGALLEKEVSTMSLLCVYAYMYNFLFIYIYIYVILHTLSLDIFSLFIACFQSENYSYGTFLWIMSRNFVYRLVDRDAEKIITSLLKTCLSLLQSVS